MLKEVVISKIVYIRSQNAEAAPPLGTVLGNIGVNTVKFCDEFNKLTINLPSYMIVNVKIDINENKTFKFKIQSLSLTFLLNLLKFKSIVTKVSVKEFMCLKLTDVVILALFKFPKKSLKESLRIILGVIKSMNILVVK